MEYLQNSPKTAEINFEILRETGKKKKADVWELKTIGQPELFEGE